MIISAPDRRLLVGSGLCLLLALALVGCQTWTAGMDLPAPRYLEHPPQYVAPDLPMPQAVASAKPADAAPTVASDLALVPGGAKIVLSVQVKRLASKLGMANETDLPGHAWWKQGIGIPLNEVERCTLVGLDAEDHRLLIVRLSKTIDRARVLTACVPGHAPVKDRRALVTSDRTGLAVLFPDDRTVLITDSRKVLLKPTPDRSPRLATALTRAATCDLFAWGDTALVQTQQVSTCTPSCRLDIEPLILDLLPIPLPDTLLSAGVAIDLAATMQLDGWLDFRTTASARQGEKLAGSLVDTLRAQMLMAHAASTFVRHVGPQAGYEDPFAGFPAELFRRIEKALQTVPVRREEKTVRVDARFDIQPTEVAKVIKDVVKAQRCPGDTCAPSPGLFFTTRQEIPPPPPPAVTPNLPAPPPPMPGVVYGVPLTPPPPPPTSPPPALRAPSTEVPFTVANVRKEEVLLFTADGAGELTFVRKLPAGEAVDLKVPVNQRWTAVFMNGPHKMTHTVKPEGGIWLLR